MKVERTGPSAGPGGVPVSCASGARRRRAGYLAEPPAHRAARPPLAAPARKPPGAESHRIDHARAGHAPRLRGHAQPRRARGLVPGAAGAGHQGAPRPRRVRRRRGVVRCWQPAFSETPGARPPQPAAPERPLRGESTRIPGMTRRRHGALLFLRVLFLLLTPVLGLARSGGAWRPAPAGRSRVGWRGGTAGGPGSEWT
jgi:hypothetical protein